MEQTSDASTNSYQTPEYIQNLQAQIAKMANDNSKGIYVIDKYTLNKMVKLLLRDEQTRIASRESHRKRHH